MRVLLISAAVLEVKNCGRIKKLYQAAELWYDKEEFKRERCCSCTTN